MKYVLQQSRFQHLIKHRNGYLMLASVSLLLNVLLFFAMFVVITHERIVIVPPVIEKPLWVTSSQVSPEYLSEMSLFFANLRLNVTASNAASQRDILLRFIDPQHYNEIKSDLLNEGEALKKNHVATAFIPTNDVKVDTKKLIAKMTGDLYSMVGDVHLPAKHVTYQIKYHYQQGRLIVTAFDEVVSHV